MEYKERDVARLNRENDEYVRKRQESVKRQLEEAVLEQGGGGGQDVQSSGGGKGGGGSKGTNHNAG